ncbi:ABC transporter ATP-binding protein [Streptomyces populi]|uniref:ABC transporter ATP-binding protein n=1 Tax=Streptomyces populi TaxID=2058924 RepID=A0A2I0SJ32_9ACTN|nr:ATP-binding cassette domain-containing protein [Streptomyces populi]PKT69945.1 ABC transporter ATP-binding protein [Streptomyces populi]
MDGPHGLRVTAEDFGLDGPRGRVFRGVRLDAEPGSLIAVEGPSGSGRTCLLLALTGRMKATEGTAAVGPARLPKQMAAVRRVSALAHVPGVTDLDPALTVGEHLRERALLQRRFGGSLRALLRPRGERAGEARSRIGAALTAAGLDLDALPKGPRTAVRDLERLETLRLSLALALIGRPRLLGVDDTDLKLSDAERSEVWALLRSVAESGTTVVAVCSEAPEGAVVVSTAPAGTARATAGEDTGTEAATDADAETETETAASTDTDTTTATTTATATASDSDSDSDSGNHDRETADALA